MQLALPMAPWSSWSSAWLSYVDQVDALYNVYTASLWLFNIPNARNDGTDNSQGKFWLLGIPNRFNQNSARDALYAVSTSSWTGVLSLKAITHPFNKTISTIDNGNIKMAVYKRYASMIKFNESTDLISSVKDSKIDLSWYDPKWYIATSWGNNFLIVWNWSTAIESYPVWATNYEITWSMAGTVSPWWAAAYVACVINQYVRIIYIDIFPASYLWAVSYIRWSLYSISSTWLFTLVWSTLDILTYTSVGSWWGGISKSSAIASYVSWNKCYLFATWYAFSFSWSPWRMRSYWTIDLATLTWFTYTNIANDLYNVTYSWSYTWQSAPHQVLIWWYDVTNNRMLYVTWFTAGKDIWKAEAAWFSDTTSDYFGIFDNFCRYAKTLSVLTTATNNVNITATNWILINNSAVSWTITNLNTNSIFIYKMSLSNQEDDVGAFAGLYLNGSASISLRNAILDINGTAFQTNAISLANSISASWYKDISVNSITWVLVNSSSIKFWLTTNNPDTRDHKIWFWLTGWTYTVPTGTNDHWWSGSVGSTIGANGSKMDITIG